MGYVPVSSGFNPKSHKVLIELLVIVAVVVAIGIGTVWGGGYVASAMTPLVSIDLDKKLGSLSAQQVALGSTECTNPAAKKYVEDLAAPLLAQAGKLPFPFEFRVVEDPSVNAFALPGGYVTVNSGLLAEAATGEEVAGVLGHEIQHALLRHGTKRILREIGGSVALAIVLGGSDLHEIGQLGSRMTGLTYDRGQEAEADKEGVKLLTAAGIDASGLAVFFERLGKEGMTPPEFLSTHPDPGNRAAEIRKMAQGKATRTLPSPKDIKCHSW